jgi:hypothetical protein
MSFGGKNSEFREKFVRGNIVWGIAVVPLLPHLRVVVLEMLKTLSKVSGEKNRGQF